MFKRICINKDFISKQTDLANPKEARNQNNPGVSLKRSPTLLVNNSMNINTKERKLF